jgi:putative FmdB family regulatory protein
MEYDWHSQVASASGRQGAVTMPTYEYRCAKCGEHLEVFQSFTEKPLAKHGGCGGKLTKVLSPAGIVLKGSGFYKTDSRSGAKTGASKDPGSKDPGPKDSSSKDSSSKDSSASTSSKSSESSGSSGSPAKSA